ncbi:polymorphic toxin-type HINT domain-containing protein [Sphaerisporangium krabiense]|uniref:RHS repeat-associated protein n=1 Tax=Sphaerisporangium krabiense TaxID=763782 RepID=A0A7W8Z8P7_9ACTN|nr:polymorphic toxin-type HINT domain-containing protein [Sphaerisporangium krabiense]MBB5629330.1 RHS repeat-associated protein [Sphaerisporangium krabiense]
MTPRSSRGDGKAAGKDSGARLARDCFYAAYSSIRTYRSGDKASYQDHDWEALKTAVAVRPGTDSSYWRDLGLCYVLPPAAPEILDMFPMDQDLVGVTPVLSAYARSAGGVYGIDYVFEVCDEQLTCSSSGVIGDHGAWRVPQGRLSWGKPYQWTVTATDRGTGGVTSKTRRFLTGVRQPVLTSQLAANGANGQEFEQLTGNYTTSFTDAAVTTVGPPLTVSRSYNSMDPRTDGMFGAGWSSRWDMKVLEEAAGQDPTAVVTFPDGRRVRFAAKADGSYQPPPGLFATLAKTQSGGVPGWRLMDKSTTVYVFDAQGRLTGVTDNRGRSQTLTYGGDAKLAKVTGTGGRSLTFVWTGSHVTGVSTDPVDGAALTWTYQYDGDRLTRVCSPAAAPNCTAYDYGTGSQYRSRVLDADPVGYWRLGESSGTVAADTAQETGDATYYQPTLGQPGALAGTQDTAVKGSVKLPENTIARLGGRMSVELWFKAPAPGTILSAGDTGDSIGANRPVLYVGTDGKLRGQLWDDPQAPAVTPITSAAPVNDDQWHHVVLTAEGQAQILYLDGQRVGTLAVGPDGLRRQYAYLGTGWVYNYRGWPATPPMPGNTYAVGFPLTGGTLDEPAVYDRALTEAEVRAHHAARVDMPFKLTKITLPSGRVWAENVYDTTTERVKTHTDEHGGTWQIGVPVYNATTGLSTVTVTDPHAGKLEYRHDAWRGYRLVSYSDQLAKVAGYEYDDSGYLSKVTDRNGNTTGLYHDDRGNLIGRENCRTVGNCQTAYYRYYLNASNAFDPRNDSLIAARDPRSSGSADNTYASTWDYNAYGELAAKKTPATPDFPSGRSQIYAYTDGTEAAVGGGTTPAGLLKSSKDYKGNEKTYRYTSAGDLAEGTLPSGLVIKYGYDALGRLTSRTSVSAAHPTGVTTTLAYDGLGQVVKHTGAAVTNEITGTTHTPEARYTYDADGNKLTDSVVDLTGGDPTRTTTYTYDTYGRAETVTDPLGKVVTTSWDHTGARVSTVDQVGTRFAYAYTPRGELASRTLKGWTGSPVRPQAPADVVLESYAYDPGGRLASVTDAMGRKRSYTYYNDNQPSQEIADDVRLNGSATPADVVLGSLTYDAAGNITRWVDGGLTRIDYVYDAADRMTSQTIDPAARALKTTYAYDANENVTKETRTGAGSARTEVTDYAYDVSDQLIRSTVENGADDLVTTWTVDDRALVTGTTDPRGNVTGADPDRFTTTYRYDAAERLIETKGPQVQIEKLGSATAGRPVARYGYDAASRLTHVTDPEGRTTITAYDKAGQVVSETMPSYTPPGGGTTLTPAVAYTYDDAGRLTGVTDERGFNTSAEYDALDNLVRVTDPAAGGGTRGQWVAEYDLLGETLAAADPTGARVEATYDDLGRQITRTQIERRPVSAALTTQLRYNNAGHLSSVVAPGNKTTTYSVNAAGELTSISDPLGHASTFAYDIAGRTVKVTDPLNNSTEAEYDLAGRQVTAKDLGGSTTLRTFTYGWDAAGNQTSSSTPAGYTTRREYDASGLLVRLIEPVSGAENITTTYGYDATGALTRTTDGRGNSVWTTYNSLGLAESTVEPSTTAYPAADDRTWTNAYDAAGNAVKLTQPGGVRIDRQFDELGRLVKESGTGAAVATPDRTYTYDLADRLTGIGDYTLEYNDRSLLSRVAKPSGQVAAFSYDSRGNPSQRIDTTGTATFTWDDADRLATAAEPVSGRSFTYGYDNADRLTSLNSSTPATSQTFTYDDMDRLLTHTLKNGSGAQLAKVTYGWDKDDRLLSKITSGTAGAGTNTYGYDQNGRLTSWTAPNGNVTSYTWDAAGNRTGAGQQTYTYDERNRLLSGGGSQYTYTARGTLATETKSGATTALTFDAFDRLISDGDTTYAYDALGRLTSRTKSGATQRFTYSGLGNDIATITDGSGAIQGKFGRDPFGSLLGLQEGGGSALGALSDLHGDLVGTFSGTALVDSAAYDPFGQNIAQSGARRSLGYQGEWTDPDTGKVNMNARWYQPGTGAFASRDDWDLDPYASSRLNRYSYADGSPLTRSDPSGHCSSAAGGWPPAPCPVQEPRTQKKTQTQKKPEPKRVPPTPNVPTGDTLTREKNQQKEHKKPKPRELPPDGKKDPQTVREPKSEPVTVRNPSTPTTTPKTPPKSPKERKKDKTQSRTKTISKQLEPMSTDVLEGAPNCGRNPDHPLCGDNPANICRWNRFIPGCDGHPDQDAPIKKKKKKSVKPDDGIGYDPTITITPQGPPRDVTPDPAEIPVGSDTDDVVNDIVNQVAPDLPLGGVPQADPGCDAPTPNSFVAGTQVLMADGKHKPIEDIKIGDEVLASDPATGQNAAKPVVTLITSMGLKKLVDLTVDTDGTSGSASDVITATAPHPFWVPDLKKWVPAGELKPGMWLRTSTGTWVQVTAIGRRTVGQRVYNLTVGDLNSYHVVAGGQAVLVHNEGPPYTDEECWALADKYRDEEVKRMSNTQRRKHVMIVGGVDCLTGKWAVGKKRSRAGDFCAETLVTQQLVEGGSDPKNIRFGHPMHPDSQKLAPPCAKRCEMDYEKRQFPQDIDWDPDGTWKDMD